jgi:hypothetical protein
MTKGEELAIVIDSLNNLLKIPVSKRKSFEKTEIYKYQDMLLIEMRILGVVPLAKDPSER